MVAKLGLTVSVNLWTAVDMNKLGIKGDNTQ